MFARDCGWALPLFYDQCMSYSVEAPKTGAGGFKLALGSLNSLGERWELLEGLKWLHNTVWSSQGWLQSLLHQILLHPAEL